jgi:phage gp29-like protein
MRMNAIRGLTFERLVGYLDQFQYGYFRLAGMVWWAMLRRDYQLKICAPKRFKSVARHGYDIIKVKDLEGEEEKLAEDQQVFLQEFYDNVTAMTAIAPDEQGGLSLVLRQMMESIYYGWAVHEIVWQPQDDGSLTAKFVYCPLWWFEGTRGKLRYLDSEFQAWGREMNAGEWLITCSESGFGLAECCSLMYMLKNGALKSWVSYLDKYGFPGIVGKTHAKKGTAEWEAMKEAVLNFGIDWATVIGGCSGDLKENDVTLLQATNASNGQAFDDLVEKLDRAITQLFRGGDLGTSSGNDRQGASLQGDESEILETDDTKILEETLTGQVSRIALNWKYGPDVKALAYIKLRTTPEDDQKNDIAVDQFLLNNGAELSLQGTLERYGRGVPKDGEAVLKSPTVEAQKQGMELQKQQADSAAEFQKHQMDLQTRQCDASQQEPEEPETEAANTRFVNELLDSLSELRAQGRCPVCGKPANHPKTGVTKGQVRCGFCNQPSPRSGWSVTTQPIQFTNRTGTTGFDKAAREQFIRACQSDTAPLVERLQAIAKIQDPALFKNRLAAFLAEVDQTQKDLGQDSELAQTIKKVIAAQLANGMASRATVAKE